jgi:hypothetical protein
MENLDLGKSSGSDKKFDDNYHPEEDFMICYDIIPDKSTDTRKQDWNSMTMTRHFSRVPPAMSIITIRCSPILVTTQRNSRTTTSQ